MDEKEAEHKRSLRNEKLKANRASETEGQRKERLRIRREKDRARSTLQLPNGSGWPLRQTKKEKQDWRRW